MLKLFFKEKTDYYLKNNSNILLDENEKIEDIAKKYKLENLYYGLDNKDIFKRKDRYEHKNFLTVIFIIFCLYNLHEIIFNCYFYFIDNKHTDDIKNWIKLFTEMASIVNVGAVLVLSWLSFFKLKISTKIFY